jgi:hypothetical protein
VSCINVVSSEVRHWVSKMSKELRESQALSAQARTVFTAVGTAIVSPSGCAKCDYLYYFGFFELNTVLQTNYKSLKKLGYHGILLVTHNQRPMLTHLRIVNLQNPERPT